MDLCKTENCKKEVKSFKKVIPSIGDAEELTESGDDMSASFWRLVRERDRDSRYYCNGLGLLSRKSYGFQL